MTSGRIHTSSKGGETMAQLQPIVDIPVNFSGKSTGLPLVLIERL